MPSTESPDNWTWLMIGGCPRSGTTLLQLVLNTHPDIRITNEVSLFNTLESLRAVFGREADFLKWVERAKSHKENWTKKTLTPFIPQFQKCAGAMMRSMFEAQFRDQIDLPTTKYLGDKLPTYYLGDLSALEKLIGKITIIHLSRNPVDVVNSMLRRSRNASLDRDTWTFSHTVAEGCKHWAEAWNAVNSLSARSDANILHLKYEDVVHSSGNCFNGIASRLGVENKFDTGRVVIEDPHARDLVGPEDVAQINHLLNSIATRWEEPLCDLTRTFEQIEVQP